MGALVVRTTVLAGLVLLCVFPTGAAASPEPAVAPPATPQVAAACARQVAASAATADEVTQVPHGLLEMSGCVSDLSGIEQVVVRWQARDRDAHGRICTDPPVVDGAWACTWDTRNLPPGRYDLELVAVDAAGNRDSSTRKYELVQQRQQERVQPAVPQDSTPLEPAPEPRAPEPEPTPEPGPDTAPPPSGQSDASTVPPDVASVQPEFSSVQRLVAERVVACEQGGVDTRPTDDPQTTTQQEQVEQVLACLRPALELAGASDAFVRIASPDPIALVTVVVEPARRAELDAALPDVVAGVPALVVAPGTFEADTACVPDGSTGTPADGCGSMQVP